MDLCGEVCGFVEGNCLYLPVSGVFYGVFEACGEHGEHGADAVSSFVEACVVHGLTKRHAAHEVHMKHLREVQIETGLLSERSVLGSASQRGHPCCCSLGTSTGASALGDACRVQATREKES